jgi:hypothetical protein
MRRKGRFQTYEEARNSGPYDELPMLEMGIDPQLHLSKNDRPQPFFLICEQDTIIAQMSGTARVEFRGSSVNYFNMQLGDYVYVPAGTPHRYLPKTGSIVLRYKAEHAGLEGVAWYSEKTGEELSRVVWDTAAELPQEAYLRACKAFNADKAMRTCRTTGEVLGAIDLAPYRWAQLAGEIREAEAAERARAEKMGRLKEVAKRTGTLVIPPPADDREPLRVNVYEFAREATAALAPMFPYFAPGCIVPCVTLQDPAGRGPMGYFVHYNTVQEVNVSFGTRESYQVPGGVQVGPNTHGVGQKAGQAGNSGSMFNIAVITQRQAVGEPQKESIIFRCEKCDAEVARRDYDAHAFPDKLEAPAEPWLIGLPTITQSSAAAQSFNESDRTCKQCGHVNAPFPTDYWGWSEYRRRTHVVAMARDIMTAAAATAARQAAE